jgi:hypothetical protein
MVGSQLRSHMCVQTQYDARSIRRAACQTDRPSGVRRERDGRAVYMCTAVFLRLCSMAQSMDTKLYLKVEGGAFPVR